jgi:hypothetical protein
LGKQQWTFIYGSSSEQHTNVVSINCGAVRRRKDSFPSRDKEQPSGLTKKVGTLLTAGM